MSEIFENAVIEALHKLYPEAGIEKRDVQKTNGTVRQICVVPSGSRIGAALPVSEFENHFGSFQKDMDVMVGTFRKQLDEVMPALSVPHEIESKESVLNGASWRLLGRSGNDSYAQDCICRSWMDLMLIPQLSIKMPGGNRGSAVITRATMEQMGITEEELALACDSADVSVEDMHSILVRNMAAITGFPEQMVEQTVSSMFGLSEKRNEMLVCSLPSRYYGASAFLHDGLLADVAEKFGGDVMILPASVHETILLPAAELDIARARKIVQVVNHTEIEQPDFLSDNVYIYRRSTGKITMGTGL